MSRTISPARGRNTHTKSGFESARTVAKPSTVRLESETTMDSTRSDTRVSENAPNRLQRAGYVLAGATCVGLGGLGLFLPGLPTTPFLLLASWCFGRSSPRLHQALLRSQRFGPMIRNWERHRAIPRRVRNLAVGCVSLVLVGTAFSALGLVAKMGILVLGAIGLTVVLRLRTLADDGHPA